MFFRMCNSLSTFQQMMNDIFSDEMHKGFLVIYMDDLMIFTCDMSKAEYAKLVKWIWPWSGRPGCHSEAALRLA